MGIGSTLAKILGIGGSLAAIPFTGGASAAGLLGTLGTIGKVAGAVAPVVGGLAAGRAAGKQQTVDNSQNQDALKQRMYDTLVNAQLQRAKLGADQAQFQRDSPSVRFQQALKGGAAANMQDVSVNAPSNVASHVVNFSGGARPSAIGPQGREAGAHLAALANAAMGKDSFALPDLPTQPGLTPLPKAGLTDKILGIGGPALSFLGALGGGQQSSPSLLQKYGGGQAGPQLSPVDAAYQQQNQPGLYLPNYGPDDPRLRLLGGAQ